MQTIAGAPQPAFFAAAVCASYSSKESPHVEGLLVTIADALKKKEEEIAQRRAEGLDIAPQEAARQILHRLLSATNRRMHKGFPEMFTYLLDKPMEYCSHEFVHLNLHSLLKGVLQKLHVAIGRGRSDSARRAQTDFLRIARAASIRRGDYYFRPKALEDFPLYFFMAATEARKSLGSDSLAWATLQVDGHGRVAKVIDECQGDALGPSGCASADYDARHSFERQLSGKPVMSSKHPGEHLQTPARTPIYEYDYYVHLKLDRAWRVPVVHAPYARPPEKDTSNYEKTRYALVLMLLFRPFRSLEQVVDWCGVNVDFRGDDDRAWARVYDAFVEWRKRVEAAAAKYYRDVPLQQPPPLSEDWWSCLVFEKLRNWDAMKKRHGTEVSKAPENLSLLPDFVDPAPGRDDADPRERGDSDVGHDTQESDSSGDEFGDPDLEAAADPVPRVKRAEGTAEPLSRFCGTLPNGSRLEEFHEPPLRVHARDKEGQYRQGFAAQSRKAFPSRASDCVLVNSSIPWTIGEFEALEAARQQQLFFKSVDKGGIEVKGATASKSRRRTDFDDKVAGAVAQLPAVIPSDTVVLEAAFYLLEKGLLNIPDVGILNVKQARAFLWNAVWLQDYMSQVWRDGGPLEDAEARVQKFPSFQLVIIGPGGTGKTAVLKITEALTEFFAGVDTVRKLAPSNAAARLLGGDTLHALCKLPFGNARLTSKKGRLGSTSLCAHRKTWKNALASYVDEVSMISSDQLLQCDVRMRQAKMRPDLPFGGLAMTFCGDFMQLPPVDKDGSRKSLAMSHDDPEEDAEGDGDDAAARQQRRSKHVEGRQGFTLWRTFERVVQLTVNVRAPGILSRLQQEMRSGEVSEFMWGVYMSRVLQDSNDPRLTSSESPFATHDVHFIVHRHKIRVQRSLENAKEQSKRAKVPLYIVQANDEPVRNRDSSLLTAEVRKDLLRLANPDQTKGLPGFLPLYVGMRLLISSKDCVRLGIMKGCPCILRGIVFSDDETLPMDQVSGQPHHLTYMPASLILQAEGADWTLPSSELPSSLPANIDRRGFFQLRPTYDYISAKVGEEYFKVRRTTFQATPADTMTVYAAQGSTFDAVVVDMERPPNLDLAKHWLACYVMLSRARSLDGLLILRPATKKELSSRPPKYMLDELDRLEKLEDMSTQELIR